MCGRGYGEELAAFSFDAHPALLSFNYKGNQETESLDPARI